MNRILKWINRYFLCSLLAKIFTATPIWEIKNSSCMLFSLVSCGSSYLLALISLLALYLL